MHCREHHNPALLYDTLLPFLNSRPLLANINPNGSNAEFRTVPPRGDASKFRCILEAMRQTVGRVKGCPPRVGKLGSTLVKWTLCKMMERDLQFCSDLTAAEALVVRSACRRLAHAGSRNMPSADADPALVTQILSDTSACIAAVDARLRVLRSGSDAAMYVPPVLDLKDKPVPWAACYPLFGMLCRTLDVEPLAGGAPVPPILRPVQLSLCADRVRSHNEAATALRHAVHLCTLLGNQAELIKNTYCVRVALIQHLVTQVIPLPLPQNHPRRSEQCFWASSPMRYETQADILRLLDMLCRHFTSSALSLKVRRSSLL